VCITIAIVKMVSPLNVTTGVNSEDDGDITYDWSEKTQGAILSSYFIGYTCSLFIGGYLAETFGGKWILALGLLLSAITSILTPPLVEIGNF